MRPDLSVVIPAFNEEPRLAASLHKIFDHLEGKGRSFEVLVVDDGSTDGTAGVAERLSERGVRVIRQPRNMGKGAALRAGVLASGGQWVLLTDADLSTPIDDLERLQPHVSERQIVFGSRVLSDSNITRRQPLYRVAMGKVFNLLVRSLGLAVMRDTQCGFKLLAGDAARELFAETTIDHFAYDVELLWLARQKGYSVKEVGVTWHDNPATTVRAMGDSARMFMDLLRIRSRHPTPRR